MIKIASYFFISIWILFTVNLYSQIQSNGTGGGNWDSTATWQGGVVPGSSDNVVILGTDTVVVTNSQSCANLTMNAGSKITIATGLTLPGTSWNLDAASTVEYLGVPSSFVYTDYGNLIYSGANYSLSNNLSVKGNLYITSATLRGIGSASGNLTHTVEGDVIVGPGTGARISAVNQSSATTASCTWDIKGNLSLTGNNSGNRLILFESAGPHSGTARFIIGGDLTIGTTSGSASQVQYRSSSGTIAYGTGIIDLKGNLIKNGKIGVQANSSAGTFDLNLIGTSNQNWSGSGALDILSLVLNINVNNPAGITISVPQTLGANVLLNLINGKVTTDNVNLITVGSGAVVGGSSSSFIDGPLAQLVASTGPAVIDFPIGKDTAFRPVSLTVSHDSATATVYTAEQFNSAPPVNVLPPTLNKVSEVRYFTITKGSGATVTAASVQLSYDADDGVTDFANLRIAKDDGAGNWVDIGGLGTANTAGIIASTANFTSFSNFVLANDTSGSNLIPVELTSFTASIVGKNVTLRWSTATESNNSGFEIQRKTLYDNSRNWTKVGFVKGAGSTVIPQEYSFDDKINSANGSLAYRLKQVNFDGTYEYSKVVNVVIDLPKHYVLSQNYPNPFNPTTTIKFDLPRASNVLIKVYDILGNEVALLMNEKKDAGSYEVQFDADRLSTGTYFYQIAADNFIQTKKMIVIK